MSFKRPHNESSYELQSFKHTNNSELQVFPLEVEPEPGQSIKSLQEEYDIDQKKLIRKLDYSVTVPIFVIFFIANINKSNFGTLYLKGMGNSLGMGFYPYFTAIAVFFAPYVFFQSFSNLILRYIRPHFWISVSTLFYGAIILGQGFIKNYSQLLACNFLHGLFQAGTDTSMMFLLTSYYSKTEIQKRVGIIYCCSCLGVFWNNIIGYGLGAHVKERAALDVWQWLLIINGITTMVFAVIIFFIMPDFPEGNRFLQDYETIYIIRRLEILYGKSGYNAQIKLKDIWYHLKDIMIWLPALAMVLLGGAAYNFSFVEPFVFHEFSGEAGFLKSSWMWLAGAGSLLITGYLCDYLHHTFSFVVFNLIVALAGIICINKATVNTIPLVDAGTYLIIIGCFTAFPIFTGLSIFNLNGHLRRSICTSLMMAGFDLGGVYAIFIFKNNDVFYRKASYLEIGLIAATLLIVLVYGGLIRYKNAIKTTTKYKEEFDELSDNQKILHGDRSPFYKYLY